MAQNRLMACFKGSAMVGFLLFFQLLHAQNDFNALNSKLLQYQKQLGGNVVTLVYKGDKIVFKKELGTDFKANEPAPIASCSKWLTAALVMTFVDEGKLSLDDKITTFIPIFDRYSKRNITIRECLSHLTGIEGEGVYNDGKAATLEEQMNVFAGKRDIKAQPGTEFRYSNVGLNIAGRILEIISKKSFEQLAQQRLFRPLGMKNTTFQQDFDKAPDPSGGAISTAADYMNFLVMILNKGMFKGKRILSEKSVELMEQAQTTQKIIKYTPKAGEGLDYGLGELLLEQDANGKGTSIACPGLFGTWPIVDNCRGYACIIFVSKLLGTEPDRSVYLDIKSSIDSVIPCAN